MPAESEGVVERDINLGLLCHMGNKIQVKALIRVVKVDCGGKNTFVDRHDRGDRFKSARGTKRMTSH